MNKQDKSLETVQLITQSRDRYDRVIKFANNNNWLSLRKVIEDDNNWPSEHFLTPSGNIILVAMFDDDISVTLEDF